MITVTTPYPQFAELDGSPLDNGAVYIGTAGLNSETNPIAVFWDNAGTQPAAQPLTTRSGIIARNGAPARVYVNAAAYSLLVKDKQGRLIAYEASISSAVGTDNIDNGSITEAKLATAVTDKLNGALQRTGGTMTGAIVLAGNAVNALNPVPLQQLGTASALSFSSLALSATGTNSNVAITANELLLRGADGSARVISAVNITVNTAAMGANGLDTGTLATSTWYAVWAIWNGVSTAGLVSLSHTAPTMPAGYTHKARVGWIRTDGTINKWPLGFTQRGRVARYLVGSGNVSSTPIIISGTQGNSLTPVYVAASISSVAPPTVASVFVTLIVSGTLTASVAPNGSYGNFGSVTNPPPMGVGANNNTVTQSADILLEGGYPQNIYYTAGAANAALSCTGWQDNL